MFAKAKRFPDENKDYIPGPGEYNVQNGETPKHRHYGFLDHSSRFMDDKSECGDHFYASGDNSTPSLSSDTRLSYSTSSNLTESRRLAGDPLERYRAMAQKEIDSLQAKARKLEASLQKTADEKTEAQAALLSREQELAELRAKNAAMQKTITRLERSPKTLQLQRKLDESQHELETSKNQCDEAQQKLEECKEERDALVSTKLGLLEQLEDQKATLEETVACLSSVRQELSHIKEEKSLLEAEMHDKVEHMQTKIDAVQREMEQQRKEHQRECEEWHVERAASQDRVAALEQQLQDTLCAHQLLQADHVAAKDTTTQLSETVHKRDDTISVLDTKIYRLQFQFETYRRHMADSMKDLRRASDQSLEKQRTELFRVLAELSLSKKFINKQALHVETLQSQLHWLSKANQRFYQLLVEIDEDAKQESQLHARLVTRSKKQIPSPIITTKVYPVNSTTQADPKDQFNDSGFGRISPDTNHCISTKVK